MTFAFIGALVGALLGTMRVRRKGGNRLDLLQYATVFAIIGGLLGFMLAIVVVRAA